MDQFVVILRCCTVTALVLFGSPLAVGDFLVVSRPATIKATPHPDAEVLHRPIKGETLRLVRESQTNGYYLVEMPDRSGDGWIYRTLARRHRGSMPSTSASASGLLEVHVINVGQADAIYIRCPDGEHQLLIDAGDTRYPQSGARFRAYMTRHHDQDDPIEVVVASHPHADHIGNMAWLLQTISVGLYVDNGNAYSTATYRRVEEAFAKTTARYWSAQDELLPDIDFCIRSDVSAVILRSAHFGEHNNPNDNSVIVRVDYGEDSFLFVGDAEGEVEADLLADSSTVTLLDCDFLKVGHHGSDTSSTPMFVAAVTPSIAAISCGERDVGTNRGYRHPRRSTVETLRGFLAFRPDGAATHEVYNASSNRWETMAINGALYVTASDGDLVFVSDGASITRQN